MKTNTKFLVFFLFSFFYALNSNAQVVSGMNYQAVIRNSSNALIASTVVGVKISILQGSATGTVVFSERHTPTTNTNGLATFVIGEGTPITSNFFNIIWTAGLHFIKIETDPTGGTNYTITNTSQLNTVPYSQFSENSAYASFSGDSWKKTGNVVDLNTDFIGSVNNVDVVFKRNNAKAGKIGLQNTYLGVGAGEFNIMNGNVAIGTNALNKGGGGGSVGNLNTAVGYDAYPNNVQGYGNAAFGNNSLFSNTHGYYNAAIGNFALQALTTGNYNAALGSNSLSGLTTGTRNIGLGADSSVPSSTASNQLSIGNVIYGANMGNTATGTIGIGVQVPTEKLEVAGKTKTINLQVTAGAGVNKVLTSDVSGNATWQNTNKNTGFDVRADNQTIGAGSSNTKVAFTIEDTDDSYSFSEVSNSFTVPSNGFYHFSVLIAMENPVSQFGYLTIRKNSNTLRTKVEVLPVTTTNEFISIDADSTLVSGDVITVYFTTNLSNVILAGHLCRFSGFKVY
jgi:hypothetical protein